jgi:hypothetical protein
MTDDKGAKAASRSQELGMMEGKGFYNRHSGPKHSAVAFGLPLLERAVEAVPWRRPSLFGALDADRSTQERKKITGSFDASLQEKVAADPGTAKCAWRVALLLISKRSARQRDRVSAKAAS